jgi:hypothetical protein
MRGSAGECATVRTLGRVDDLDVEPLPPPRGQTRTHGENTAPFARNGENGSQD